MALKNSLVKGVYKKFIKYFWEWDYELNHNPTSSTMRAF